MPDDGGLGFVDLELAVQTGPIAVRSPAEHLAAGRLGENRLPDSAERPGRSARQAQVSEPVLQEVRVVGVETSDFGARRLYFEQPFNQRFKIVSQVRGIRDNDQRRPACRPSDSRDQAGVILISVVICKRLNQVVVELSAIVAYRLVANGATRQWVTGLDPG